MARIKRSPSERAERRAKRARKRKAKEATPKKIFNVSGKPFKKTPDSHRLYTCPKTGKLIKNLKSLKLDRSVNMMLDDTWDAAQAYQVLNLLKKSKLDQEIIDKLDEAIYISQRY